ncbi:toxin-antitoxin system YwqK family antitoxin [Mucilaginibacter sp.]|uniref:toxin-antitoxin system YwqK family antitoxin n=1 Tax=Mucilaginibacter sp. TaxID=1882438 RepID=UPI003D0FD326
MKQVLLIAFFLISIFIADGQNVVRRLDFHNIDRDSVNLPLNDKFYLIEDSCAQIIRHTRLNFQTRKFYGKFQDVSKANPEVIVSEGTYTTDGLKNGLFVLHYLNGNIQAKGSFKNDVFDGRWEMFYDDGKPELTFDAADASFTIINAWTKDGAKVVDNGAGIYKADLDGYYWKGKLVNGKPDGSWKMYRTDDASNTSIATERFKKGVFTEGSNQMGDYTNASRISLISSSYLPFINAEKLYMGLPCNAVPRKHIISAQYKRGLNTFNDDLRDITTRFLQSKDLEGIGNTFTISGDISVEGTIINLTTHGYIRDDISSGLIRQISMLPRLNPATVDGKPVVQKFRITYEINRGSYHYSFQFLPIRY